MGQKGAVTNYISRTQAIRKLQLSLADFRRLCILKGIYPHEPKKKRKLNKGSSAQRTYYYVKDIAFLAHEPLLEKFREFKVFMRKLRKAIGKEDDYTAKRLEDNKPVYTLDHIVKERYPTFIDALRDLDDCLSLSGLFATLPGKSGIQARVVHNCRRLMVEFMQFIVSSRSLRKVFISIKGIYYQAEIMGQTVTWITPHQFTQRVPSDVDFKVMSTFVEFYQTMLEFINFKLYHTLNLKYPPQIEGLSGKQADDPQEFLEGKVGDFDMEEDDSRELLAALNQTLVRVLREDLHEEDGIDEELPLQLTPEEEALRAKEKEEEEKLKKFKDMFTGLTFFLGREVPKESLTFVIRSFGGNVSWDGDSTPGATYAESDDSITHQIVDRPKQGHIYLSRAYVQPQWVFDCVNRRKMLPTGGYVPGASLPPHLSPFVEETEEDYVPPERMEELAEDREEEVEDIGEEPDSDNEEIDTEDVVEESDEDEEKLEESPPKPKKSRKSGKLPVGSVVAGDVVVSRKVNKEELEREAVEEKRLAKMLLSKKKRRLYEQILYSKKKKASLVRKLKQKRDLYERSKKAGKI